MHLDSRHQPARSPWQCRMRASTPAIKPHRCRCCCRSSESGSPKSSTGTCGDERATLVEPADELFDRRQRRIRCSRFSSRPRLAIGRRTQTHGRTFHLERQCRKQRWTSCRSALLPSIVVSVIAAVEPSPPRRGLRPAQRVRRFATGAVGGGDRFDASTFAEGRSIDHTNLLPQRPLSRSLHVSMQFSTILFGHSAGYCREPSGFL